MMKVDSEVEVEVERTPPPLSCVEQRVGRSVGGEEGEEGWLGWWINMGGRECEFRDR
jgi:hypothetical protein